MLRSLVERGLKISGQNFFIKNRLIIGLCYMDALLCSDLLDDGESTSTAELESDTIIVATW